MDNLLTNIKKNYQKVFNKKLKESKQLRRSGSYRKYYRLKGFDGQTVLAVYNPDVYENDAFVAFAGHFAELGFNVPQVYSYFREDKIYFVQDLGDKTLYDFVVSRNSDDGLFDIYKKILDYLLQFQFIGVKGIDLGKCYPRKYFDKQSIMWDLNYFKYFVLKQAKVSFNEQALEDDFNVLADYLVLAGMDSFMYRDFQSKNIMLYNNDMYFIDFQGGRKGAFYYDLASLLYDSKAKLTESFREKMLDYYYLGLQKYKKIDRTQFNKFYYHFVLIRMLQAFGAYGFRGLVEKKISFVKSIPEALSNIRILLENGYPDLNVSELKSSLEKLVYESEFVHRYKKIKGVRIKINSFSYHYSAYPKDETGNGGGFVFDCRSLPNPGRLEEYKLKTGLDKEVEEYLDSYAEVEEFLQEVVEIVVKAARKYANRGFENLQVNFGCTGGRHRSVYCAERTGEILRELYGLDVDIRHLMQEKW
jgi:aminoglycoside/choline kinase family phosphotransferase